jgi:hypothetical protein
MIIKRVRKRRIQSKRLALEYLLMKVCLRSFAGRIFHLMVNSFYCLQAYGKRIWKVGPSTAASFTVKTSWKSHPS